MTYLVLFLHLPDDYISSSFNTIGINLGCDVTSTRKSVLDLKKIEESRMHETCSLDGRTHILDREEKNMDEEDEVDTFILNHLCGEIMDEVMDARSDLNDFTVPPSKAKNHKSKSKKKQKSVASQKSILSK